MRMSWNGIAVLALGGLWAACDTEVIIYEKPADKRDIGLPCVLDGECSTGRCMAGVCSVNECNSDEDCRDGEICNPITHTCESIDVYACAPGLSPIVQLDVTAVDFGTVTVGEFGEDTVTINNIGDCLLTVEQAQLDSARSDPALTCDNCAVADYPKSIPPGHTLTIRLTFTPVVEQTYAGVLVLRTDDPSLSGGLVEVPLGGEGLGHARMSIDPVLVDFGNVLPNDPPATQTVTVTNVGAGTLELSRVFIDPPLTSQMTVAPAVGPLDTPLALVANQSQVFTITYDPVNLASSNAVLYVFSNDLTRTCASDATATPGVGCIDLKGDSRGPPQIQVSHTTIDFGQMTLGQSDYETVTISNNGQSDLSLQVSMTVLSSTDFRYTPPSQSIIPPGGTAFMNVYYEAAQLNQVTATLQIQSNDPDEALKNVSLLGFGVSPYNNDVLKVEMIFENGDDGFFGNDFRDVNLYMESPYGEIVDKASPNPDWTHGGANDQTNFGHPVWSSIGVQEEPERVILFDAHEDAFGTFKACAYYREDCDSIPTDLLAGLLGIGVSALLTGLTEGLISPDAQDVAEFIRNNCWSHSSSRAQISTFVNGAQVAQTSISLRAAGDYSCPVTVQRINGLYCVSGAQPPQTGCP
ncbi:MAG: choice-of-anchor D domain-containing protein [Pseudomonadota bacterium]